MFNNLYSLAYTVKTRERGRGKKENEGSNADEITAGNQEAEKLNIDRGKWVRKRDVESQ